MLCKLRVASCALKWTTLFSKYVPWVRDCTLNSLLFKPGDWNCLNMDPSSWLSSGWGWVLGVSGGDAFTIRVWGSFIISMLIYWGLGGLFTIVDLTGKPEWMLKYRVQENVKSYPVRLPFLIFKYSISVILTCCLTVYADFQGPVLRLALGNPPQSRDHTFPAHGQLLPWSEQGSPSCSNRGRDSESLCLCRLPRLLSTSSRGHFLLLPSTPSPPTHLQVDP